MIKLSYFFVYPCAKCTIVDHSCLLFFCCFVYLQIDTDLTASQIETLKKFIQNQQKIKPGNNKMKPIDDKSFDDFVFYIDFVNTKSIDEMIGKNGFLNAKQIKVLQDIIAKS